MSRDGNQQISCNYWLKLPRDITITILQKVGILHVLMSAQLVCTEWRQICTDPSMWTTIHVLDWNSYKIPYKTPYLDIYVHLKSTQIENMIKWAVDRSCGNLFHLDLDKFIISRKLQLYVFERCTQIKHLRIYYLTGRLAEKLPLLEDLELFGVETRRAHSPEALETLGRYCPRLSSLTVGTLLLGEIETLGRYWPSLRSLKIHVKGDEEAKTIAKSIPQLHHICFSGQNLVTDIGVEALLDGCPHLETLDIGKCDILEMTGAFRMIKKLPLTPTQWCDLLEDPYTWSSISAANLQRIKQACTYRKFKKYAKFIIRRAVDKSYGGLVDVDLHKFMSADILCYVVERCAQIRRLRGYLKHRSEKALCAAAARLPLLEDLELLHHFRTFPIKIVETFGRYCPRITSLTIPIDGDDGAKTLARIFPQLRYLEPFKAYGLTDVGVKALLDGCPHLESVDLLLYWSSRCRYNHYQMKEEDDKPYYVNYEEQWIIRDKVRSRDTNIRHLRKWEVSNKKRWNNNTKRGQKARRRREIKRVPRDNLRKKIKFVHWDKMNCSLID